MRESDVTEAAEAFIKMTADVMRSNAGFLAEKGRGVLEACLELWNDVMELVALFPGKKEGETDELLDKSLMFPALFGVVYPNVTYACAALLQGAVPQTYFCLRTALEAVAIAVYADEHEGLRDLDWYEKVEHRSVRSATLLGVKDSLRKVLADRFGEETASSYLELLDTTYRSLSAWIHPVATIKLGTGEGREEIPAGLIKAITLTLARHGMPPSYGIMLPTDYTEKDLESLDKLRNDIVATRLSILFLTLAWAADKNLDEEKLESLGQRAINLLKRSTKDEKTGYG